MASGEIGDTVKVFYYIPAGYERASMPVVVGFHGNDRDCSYWIETWKEYADKKGFMFFIPWFTHESFPTRRYPEKNGWDFNWRRVYVPDVGHDAVAMSRHAAANLLFYNSH